jgi:hemoglobin/transferrin/lactoferrin receptor protein
MPHIPPVFGNTTVRYKLRRLLNEVSFDYSGWKRSEDMSPFGEDNEDEATEFGFPGWYTINLKSTYQFTTGISLQLAIENIMNTFYKPYASGVAAPGINVLSTLRVRI